MADDTGIEWTDHTFNPWIGCTNVSPGCDHCYAEADADKRKHIVQWGNHPRHRTAPSTWAKPLAWNRQAARDGRRHKVFCASWSDVFDNQAPEEWRADLWELIHLTPLLDWQLLTKRPQNIRKMLPDDWGNGWRNVWLGTTTENQEEADRRISHLVSIPAVIRFLSVEPMLGPVVPDLSGIHWAIWGGESGPRRRPVELSWMYALRYQCAEAGVAFFFKQIDKVREIPADLMVRQFPGTATRPRMTTSAAQGEMFA